MLNHAICATPATTRCMLETVVPTTVTVAARLICLCVAPQASCTSMRTGGTNGWPTLALRGCTTKTTRNSGVWARAWPAASRFRPAACGGDPCVPGPGAGHQRYVYALMCDLRDAYGRAALHGCDRTGRPRPKLQEQPQNLHTGRPEVPTRVEQAVLRALEQEPGRGRRLPVSWRRC
jgi:hypothetical protein